MLNLPASNILHSIKEANLQTVEYHSKDIKTKQLLYMYSITKYCPIDHIINYIQLYSWNEDKELNTNYFYYCYCGL